MPKFFIEVPHEDNTVACAKVVQIFLQTGSHFLTHADWGCADGEHKAWFMIEAENRDEARSVIPPMFRPVAKVVQLNTFTVEEIENVLRSHEG